MQIYCIWIPAAILSHIGYAWLSINYNQNPNWNAFFWFYLLNLLPIWVFVARFSQNIIFDALLYDALMFLVFYASLVFFGSADKFSIHQWIGSILIVTGFVVMKLF